MNGAALVLGLAAGLVGISVARKGGQRNKDDRRQDYGALSATFQQWTHGRISRPTNQELRAWGRRQGLRLLGAGESRAVYAVPEGALKLAYFERSVGSDANRNEAEVWAEMRDELKTHLVPVIKSDQRGAWLLMEKVATGGDFRDAERALWRCGIVDFRRENVAKDGRMIDYGYIYDRAAWASCRRTP